jgi:gluconokinase
VAAAVGRPFQVTNGAGGSALGAAALGLHALGRAATLQEAADLLLPADGAGSRVEVSAASQAAYERARLGVPAMLAGYQAAALALTGPARTG